MTLETTIVRLELLENAHVDMQGNVDDVHDGMEDIQQSTHARFDAMDMHVAEIVKMVTQLLTIAISQGDEGSPPFGDFVLA